MRKLILFMHISLDGLTSGPEGELDWVRVDDEIFEFVGERTDHTEIALYGRGTYEIMQSYWPTAADKPNASKHDIQHSSWYNKVDKVIISKSMKGQNLPQTTIFSDHIPDQIKELKNQKSGDIIIFGSPVAAQTLMNDDLIDEFWLFLNPLILGQGKPLFKDLSHTTKLELIGTKTFQSGVICLHYQLRK